MSFQLLKSDSSQWQRLFESMPPDQQDVFYSPSFARLCQHTLNRDDEVYCAAMTFETNVVLYPFVRRNIGRLTGQEHLAQMHDITSMYGRGGIIALQPSAADIGRFHAEMSEFCRQAAVFCGFDRFHPVIGNDAWAAPDAQVQEVGGFVVVDLRP